MEITIKEKTSNYLRFEAKVENSDSDDYRKRFPAKEDIHTMFNLLKELVLENDGVRMCGYARNETFAESLLFQIQTEPGVDPLTVITSAVQDLKVMNDQFRTAFQDSYDELLDDDW